MHVRRIRSAEDVEQLRLLRNETRKYMTGLTKKIGKAAQKAWWEETARRAYLLVDAQGKALGFVYIKWDDHRNWITLGVTEDARGQGYGTMLYHTFKPVWARIRIDNEASITAAKRAGYVETEMNDDTVVMKG